MENSKGRTLPRWGVGMNITQSWFVAREAHGLDPNAPWRPWGGQIQALDDPTLPLRSDGARAGLPAPRSRRNNPTSCILTLGHYNTYQMHVQKPTLSGSRPLEGPGELTRRGQTKPKSNRGHQGKPGPDPAAGTVPGVGQLFWL